VLLREEREEKREEFANSKREEFHKPPQELAKREEFANSKREELENRLRRLHKQGAPASEFRIILTQLLELDPNEPRWLEERAKLKQHIAQHDQTQKEEQLQKQHGAVQLSKEKSTRLVLQDPAIKALWMDAAADWRRLAEIVSVRDQTHLHALFEASKIYERLDK
jgi:hypothetical protein